MATPIVTLLMSLNGGAPVSGGVEDVALSTAVVLSVTGDGISTAKFELRGFPEGFACPSGWSTASDGSYYVITNGSAAPSFTMSVWGAYAPRVTTNNGQRNGANVTDQTDTRCLLSVNSPTGQEDLAIGQEDQIDPLRRWARPIQRLMRNVETLGSSGDWYRPYDKDLKALSTLDVKALGDGSRTIDGIVYTVGGMAAATSFGLVNGTGLQCVHNTTSSGWFGGGNNSPRISARLQKFWADYNPSRHVARVSARILLTSQDANTEQVYVALIRDEDGSNTGAAAMLTWVSSKKYRTRMCEGGVSTDHDDTSNTSDDVLTTTLRMPSCYDFYSSIFGTAIPDEPEHFRFAKHVDSDELISVPDGPAMMLTGGTGNTNGAFTWTVTHLRVEFKALY